VIKPRALVEAQTTPVKTFLVCRPDFYGIHYQINPWMHLNNPVNHQLTIEQWDSLCDRLREFGASLRYIKAQPDLPDMVFTANAGTVFNKTNKLVAISNFRFNERKGEEEWFVQWFAEDGWHFGYPSTSYEGAGDTLALGKTLVCGTGFRSTEEAHNELGEAWEGSKLIVKLIDPDFYHLDTCFCPLEEEDYLICPGAFDEKSLADIKAAGGVMMEVSQDEAKKFACNAICIGRTVILPEGCPATMRLLEQYNYKAVPTPMTEFIKSGGACKCLTLEIG
jgi:N-dimethylarginine dimethylaminohydrolase